MLLAAPRVLAQDAAGQTEDDARARRYFEAGSTRYQDGDYAGAVDDFQRAYELSHRTGLLYNLYLAHERLAHLEQAADFLQRYLDAEPVLDEREQLQLRLQNLRDRIEAANAPPDTANTGTGGGLPLVTSISWGVGAAGVVAFAVFGSLALVENGSLADRCGSNAGRVCTDDDVATLRRDDLIADIGLGVAVAGAVVGFIVLLLDDNQEESRTPSSVAVLPWINHQSGGATLRLSL